MSRAHVVAIVLLSTVACDRGTRPVTLDIATTTSVKNSGLLGDLLPVFTTTSGVVVHVHAAGSGRALEMLSDGVVDLVITHAPHAEARYLEQHADWTYRKFAFNRFVIVGPPHDPANVRSASDALDAFRRIAATSVSFISRNDASGTHERETELWTAAGVRPAGDRLVLTADSMSVALRHADERVGYTLSDEATFRQMQPQLDLALLFAGDERLLNGYAVLYPRDVAVAEVFAQWLTAGAGRERLAAYRVAGATLFSAWPTGCAADRPDRGPCGAAPGQ